MTLELHLIFVTVELILLVGGLWLYMKLLRQKKEPSSSSTAEFTPNGYENYLKSNSWEGLREQAVTRANQQCELCQAPYEVVHHIKHPQTYEEDDLGNLLVVCGSCYGKLHGQRDQAEFSAKNVPHQAELAAKKVQPVSQQARRPVQARLFSQKAKPAAPAQTPPHKFLQGYEHYLFSEEVIGSGRAFIFDVYPISKQERMLVIVEDRQKGHKRFGHYHLSIPEVSVLDFNSTLRETLDALKWLTNVAKEQKDLLSNKMQTDNCTYFFDVKMASNSRMYLKISESKRIEPDSFERSHIMMFEEDFELFAAGLKKTMSFLLKMDVE